MLFVIPFDRDPSIIEDVGCLLQVPVMLLVACGVYGPVLNVVSEWLNELTCILTGSDAEQLAHSVGPVVMYLSDG